jgi:hypothetical protein
LENIIIFDVFFFTEHKPLNNKLIYLLTLKANIILLTKDNYYDDLNSENIKKVRTKFFIPYKKRERWYIRETKLLLNSLAGWIAIYPHKAKKVFFLTFDTINFCVSRIFFLKKTIYLYHHGNPDGLRYNRYKRFFDFYKNAVNHIVNMDYIQSYLIYNIGVKSKRVFVLTFPIPEMPSNVNSVIEKRKLYIGLSNSNDEKIIDNIIEYENKLQLLKRHNIRLVLRSQERQYNNNDVVEVLNKYVLNKDYEHYYIIANGVIIIYQQDYGYRVSGVLLDGLTAGKRVFGRNIPIVSYYAKKYPSNCIVFHTIEELFQKLIAYKDIAIDVGEYKSFLADHSSQRVLDDLIRIFALVNNQ